MDQATEILCSLAQIQERSSMQRHGDSVVLDGINLAEVHCIDRIGGIEHANVTKVAGGMRMTRGAISKISKKLLNKGLIESYQRPENNKEIYFRLTSSGQQVYDEHKKCHAKAAQEKRLVLEKYSEVEQSVILRFLVDINRIYVDKQEE